MVSDWTSKRLLITVRTYPVPATKGAEVSCTAAVSDKGEWIRLFPVPYRRLPFDKRFAKYQWIDVALTKAKGDPRPESYHLNSGTIKLREKVSAERDWTARRKVLRPLMRRSLCAIQKERDTKGFPTLGLFQPATIRRLKIKPCAANWTAKQREILGQKTFGFDVTPNEELEKIPFDFIYEFTCKDDECKGHNLSCTDWEMAEAYRRWKADYGDGWQVKFREKFEDQMINKFDTYFYVGTIHQHPKNWIIVGLFYPPRLRMGDLFDSD